MTSETESFGVSALEAMAAKVPVVSSNTGGIPEVNTNGITGFLSNVGNIQEMSDNVIKLLSDKVLYDKVSEAAYQNACKFNINNVLPLYEKLYEELVL